MKRNQSKLGPDDEKIKPIKINIKDFLVGLSKNKSMARDSGM
jgi:hypothetical protein